MAVGEDDLEIVPISTVLQRTQPAVMAPDLLVLRQTADLYTVMAYQPTGLIDVKPEAIARADQTQAMAESKQLLERAAQNGAALVLAPEYSIPWEALIDSLVAGMRPPTGCIWALGCESLPIGNIEQVRTSLAGVAQVLSETANPNRVGTWRYQNPLTYIFQADRQDGSGTELIVLVQFKTAPSGDRHNTEQRGMLNGSHVYLFGQPRGIRLLTLICSDVFEFSDRDIDEYADGLLLLHLQLNNNPRDLQYRRYKTKLFGADTRTELVCLNWARGTKYREINDATEHVLVTFTGSAWYKKLKSGSDTSDERISANDTKGLYFTRADGIKSAAYQFSERPGVFCLNATKVFHGAAVPAAASRLTGPEMTSFLEWSDQRQLWGEVGRVDDGFIDKVQSADPHLNDLLPLHNKCPIFVDRVASITYGDINAEDWYCAEKLKSLSLDGETVIQRITSNLDDKGAEFRDGRLAAVATLAKLRVSDFPWPSEVSFLGNDYQINWAANSPHRNVYKATAGETKCATVVCLSPTVNDAGVDRKDRAIRHLLAGSLPDSGQALTDKQKRDRDLETLKNAKHVCIIYLDGVNLKPWMSSYSVDYQRPSNTSDTSVTDASFRRRTQVQSERE